MSEPLLVRVLRWFLGCRHDWEETGAVPYPGAFVACERKCLKCGAYQHRLLRIDGVGHEEEEWERGPHPAFFGGRGKGAQS